MNILVLGNGFDLAHGLPTKYTDFLKFVEVIMQVIKVHARGNSNNIDWKGIHGEVKKIIEKNIGNVRNNLYEQKSMWENLSTNNVWIEYFLKNPMYKKENWIDFESEISRVIQVIDDDMISNNLSIDDKVNQISIPFLSDYFLENMDKKYQNTYEEGLALICNKGLTVSQESDYMNKYMNEHPVEKEEEDITYKQLIDRLQIDLEKMIRALEIYLEEYVKKIQIEKLSPNINSLKIDKVISFNYTDTYQRIYGMGKKIEYDYIHGKANIENKIETNNMVLGIDEYLLDDRKNKDIEFIAFKKYFQRIHKKTGCEYKKWIEEIRDDWDYNKEYFEWEIRRAISEEDDDDVNGTIHRLYIFGHSLDVTDGDILRDLILNDNVYTTIYYRNQQDKDGNYDNGKKDLATKIANLVKIIKQDELIKRTGGTTKTIFFELQADLT